MTRHRFDPVSAVAGLLFLGLALLVAARPGPLGLAELQLVGPIGVLLLGIALLVSGGRDTAAPSSAPPASPSERDQASADSDAGHGGDRHGGDG